MVRKAKQDISVFNDILKDQVNHLHQVMKQVVT
jgi:hypothetical protein